MLRSFDTWKRRNNWRGRSYRILNREGFQKIGSEFSYTPGGDESPKEIADDYLRRGRYYEEQAEFIYLITQCNASEGSNTIELFYRPIKFCTSCTNRIVPKKDGKYCSTCRTRRMRVNSPFRYYYGKLRGSARRRGKVFTLTLSEFKDIWLAEPEKWEDKKRNGETSTWEMDRKDNTKGYVKGNIQLITKTENVKKYYNEDIDHEACNRTIKSPTGARTEADRINP